MTTLTGYPDFEGFSRNFLQQGMDTLTKLQVMSPPYSLPYQEAQMVTPLVVAGFIATGRSTTCRWQKQSLLHDLEPGLFEKGP
ncbi:MAG: hypothetical protein WCK09_21650 [Bacteroidota bacterium]